MKLIADSGSTKTDWCLTDNGKALKQFQSQGINPFHQDEKAIRQTIEPFYPSLKSEPITAIYFYGAGCSFDEKKLLIVGVLRYFFPTASIEVQSDMLSAARALLGNEAGIACILGTGSNSCFYDGRKITANVSPLGYILGDEGSGAALGKRLVADVLKNQLPENLRELFFAETQTTPEIIMEYVYRKPFPNRYLAHFTRFLYAHLDEPVLRQLVKQSFVAFFERNVKQYDFQSFETHFIGSIAYHFDEVLREAAVEVGVKIGKIEQNPMQGLIEFHK